jgi:hypothetical protein
MQINNLKTKAILFNSSRYYDFMPKCSIAGGEELEVVEEIKLLVNCDDHQ